MPKVNLPTCTSCNKPILVNERASKFYCPSCGKVMIWRCEKCREFARPYRCINCGFEGP